MIEIFQEKAAELLGQMDPEVPGRCAGLHHGPHEAASPHVAHVWCA